MIYQGGKTRISKHIVPLILDNKPEVIVEPFVGGANFTRELLNYGFNGEIVINDLCKEMTCLFKSVLEGWKPDISNYPSREEYLEFRKNRLTHECNPVKNWSSVGATFNGVQWSSYVENKLIKGKTSTRNYAEKSIRASIKTFEVLYKNRDRITINQGSYEALTKLATIGTTFYCDPPYFGTRGYLGSGKFDNETFWITARKWSLMGADVFVSEETAPQEIGAITVWEKEINRGCGTHNMGSKAKNSTEKLFYLPAGGVK